MDAVSASISMAFSDKEVLASRWLVLWSGFIQLFAFIVQALALANLSAATIADHHDGPCSVALPWIEAFHSQQHAPSRLWLYVSFRLVLWLAQLWMGISQTRIFNEVEHNRYEESRRVYGPRWERIPATVTTSYLLFCSTMILHSRYLGIIRDELGLVASQGRVLISEWGQSAPFIVCIAALSHVIFVHWRLFQQKAWKNREFVRKACEDPSKKVFNIPEDPAALHWYQRHPMTLFNLLQPVDHCLIFPVEDGLESNTVDPTSVPEEKQQELWNTLLESVESNDAIGVRVCLRDGAPLRREHGTHEILLHKAARHGRQELLQLLCDPTEPRNLTSDVASRNASGETPLQCAVSSQNTVAIRFFLEQYKSRERLHGARNRNLISSRLRAFEEAILSNSPEIVRPFVDYDLWPQWKNVEFSDYEPPHIIIEFPSIVAFAYSKERWAVARLLIEKGGDMRRTDERVIKPKDLVHLAALTRDTTVLEHWLPGREDLHDWVGKAAEMYPSLNFREEILAAILRCFPESAVILWYHAKELGDAEVVRHLATAIRHHLKCKTFCLVATKAETDVHRHGNPHPSPYFPVTSPQADILRELQKKGSALFPPPKPRNRRSQSRNPVRVDNLVRALMVKCPTGLIPITYELYRFGTTVLHVAAGHGDLETTKMLLEAGFPFRGADLAGLTPLAYAQKQEHLTLEDVPYLKQRTHHQGRKDYAAVEKLLANAKEPNEDWRQWLERKSKQVDQRALLQALRWAEMEPMPTPRCLALLSGSDAPYVETEIRPPPAKRHGSAVLAAIEHH